MTLLVVSFLAGILTVLAPCILPLLPVVIGSSSSLRSPYTPYIVVGSLSLSIILFTYILKFSTIFISVPQSFWAYLSGGIILVFGLTLVFPTLWEKLPLVSKLSVSSNKVLGRNYLKKTFWGDVVVGASLGPIFSACSPTYFLILATVLPASFLLGSLYLFAFTLGLALVLLPIALLGAKLTSRLTGLSNPRGWFKKSIGIVFILLGIAVISGFEKKFETKLIENNYFDVTKLETLLLRKIPDAEIPSVKTLQVEPVILVTDPALIATPEVVETELSCGSTSTSTFCMKKKDTPKPKVETIIKKKEVVTTSKTVVPPVSKNKYVEIVNPSGFVNSNDLPFTIGQYVGKQVILLNVMTYSCSNCQATFPYVNTWYETYKDKGFVVIGIHTPEFAYEKDKKNVIDAMKEFGITYPVVMDNDYSTWTALGNRFWPRKYLIDIHGNVVFDHIGEGAYEETEEKIKELLQERKKVLGE